MPSKRLPDASEKIVDENGLLTDQARLFFLQLQDLIEGNESPENRVYADLAAVQARIKSPVAGKEYGFVTGQGKFAYNGTNFVLASDYTTLIT